MDRIIKHQKRAEAMQGMAEKLPPGKQQEQLLALAKLEEKIAVVLASKKGSAD